MTSATVVMSNATFNTDEFMEFMRAGFNFFNLSAQHYDLSFEEDEIPFLWDTRVNPNDVPVFVPDDKTLTKTLTPTKQTTQTTPTAPRKKRSRNRRRKKTPMTTEIVRTVCAPNDVETVKQLVGHKGHFFIQFTEKSGCRHIWHCKKNNDIILRGSRNAVDDALRMIVNRVNYLVRRRRREGKSVATNTLWTR